VYSADNRKKDIAVRYFAPFTSRFKGRQNVLEVASGQGFFLELLRDEGVNATGIEIDQALTLDCQARGLKAINASVFDHLKANQRPTYDGIMASHIVEHFYPEQVEEMFGLLGGVAQPGCRFIVLTPNIANIRRAVGDFWRDVTHKRPYPISTLKEMLIKTGWEIEETGEYTDRKPSIFRTLSYGIRNALIGRYWVGDDLYVIARRPVAK
jgi:2-polyprenyl-3-methyl-5-hydroxy-6-metoxy-1,4-benzoquinol methylase